MKSYTRFSSLCAFAMLAAVFVCCSSPMQALGAKSGKKTTKKQTSQKKNPAATEKEVKAFADELCVLGKKGIMEFTSTMNMEFLARMMYTEEQAKSMEMSFEQIAEESKKAMQTPPDNGNEGLASCEVITAKAIACKDAESLMKNKNNMTGGELEKGRIDKIFADMKIDTCGYVNLKGQANDDPMENAEFVVGKTKNGWNILIMLMGNAGDMNK